jgi:hypothetical protein
MSPCSPTFEEGVTRVSRRLAGGIRWAALLDPLRPLRTIERQAHHLHEVEQAGESEYTPWIAVVGLVLFLVSVFVLMTAIAFTAAHFAQ